MAKSHPIPTDPRFQDIRGQVFGRLTVTAFAGKGRHRQSRWVCRCSCGKETIVTGNHLKGGRISSCKCLQRELFTARCRRTTHGLSKRPEYKNWHAMINRCYGSDPEFQNYGGRDISVCDRWLESFANFFADMGPKPSPRHSLDRIDNDGDYEPGNCRWATDKEQGRNRSNCRYLTLDGRRLCIAEWVEVVGIPRDIINRRLRHGWSDEQILTTPAYTEKPGRRPEHSP